MLANERRDDARLKRGGEAVTFSFGALHPKERSGAQPAHELTPERVFERPWAEAVLARTLDRLQAEYTGHALRFEELKPFLIEARGSAPFEDVSARLGVTEPALKSVVHQMRRRPHPGSLRSPKPSAVRAWTRWAAPNQPRPSPSCASV